MQTIDSLDATLRSYLDEKQSQQVRRAYYYAEQAHYGQQRRSGEPYVTHPLAVAGILADMHMDHQSLMAAMLHDVIEDTGTRKDAIEEQFGAPVAELVDGVSKLTQIEFATLEEKQAENFQKMALAMARDIRVILVKLADRLHNMRTLGVLPNLESTAHRPGNPGDLCAHRHAPGHELRAHGVRGSRLHGPLPHARPAHSRPRAGPPAAIGGSWLRKSATRSKAPWSRTGTKAW